MSRISKRNRSRPKQMRRCALAAAVYGATKGTRTPVYVQGVFGGRDPTAFGV